MAIGIDHNRDTKLTDRLKVLDVRVGLMTLDPVLGIDLQDVTLFLDQFQAFHQGIQIPVGRHIEALVTLSVHEYLVHMADDVDASSLNGRQLGNLAKIVYKQEPLILHALQISEARLNSYTKPMEDSFIANVDKYRPKSLEQLGKLWYEDNDDHHTEHYHSSRYHGVNFHSLYYRGTVEFRWFEATLHAGKVKSYIQYCLLLVNRAREVKFAASKKRCLSMESAKYDLRVHLLRIGAIGDEYKTMRHFLLENMPGCASYKHKPESKVA